MEVDGLWYIAKAIALAKGNEAAQQRISEYGKARYKKYHGSEDGWQELLAAAASETAPLPDFGSHQAGARAGGNGRGDRERGWRGEYVVLRLGVHPQPARSHSSQQGSGRESVKPY